MARSRRINSSSEEIIVDPRAYNDGANNKLGDLEHGNCPGGEVSWNNVDAACEVVEVHDRVDCVVHGHKVKASR